MSLRWTIVATLSYLMPTIGDDAPGADYSRRLFNRCTAAADALEGRRFVPPQVVLNALRDLTEAAEESAMPEAAIEAMRSAYQEACALLGDPSPPEGNFVHEAVQLTRGMIDRAIAGCT